VGVTVAALVELSGMELVVKEEEEEEELAGTVLVVLLLLVGLVVELEA
jgi:hypothetical protein